MENIDFSVLLKDWQMILKGIETTIVVSLFSAFLSFVIGSVFVYFKTDSNKKVSKTTSFFINVLRNTPLLILIYIFYKGLPSVNIVMPAIVCGVIALSLYTAAYVSDAIMTGINAVPTEHFQASKALGLNRFQIFYYVVYPQAVRHSIFIIANQYMSMVKNSSLVSFVAVTDIFYVVYKGMADSFRMYEYFVLAIVLYSLMSAMVLVIANILNRFYKIPVNEVSL